jgi:hypothetical protein
MNDQEKKTEVVSQQPMTVAPQVPKEDEVDFSPFFNYLQSPQGHEMASRVLALIEGLKKVTIDKTISHAKFNRWMEAGVISVVIAAVVTLSILDKLNPTVGILLGSVVGYFFGKNK